MFNLFKKKYKRSEWMQGLLEAENLVQEGWRASVVRLYGESSLKTYGGMYIHPEDDYTGGFFDYLDYFENNLKKMVDLFRKAC